MVQQQLWPDTICSELLGRKPEDTVVDLRRYERLRGYYGHRLISSWFRRAWHRRDCPAPKSFQPFIYTWISFNGWASCVTEHDDDWAWRYSLLVCPQVIDDFAQQVSDSSSPLFDYAREFQQLWPIFTVREMRAREVPRWHTGNRREVVQSYLEAGLHQYEPGCWKRHQDEGNPVPLDWPHTLRALYRVRCNLFHGEKGLDSEMDARVVSSAFRVLVYFLHDSGYIAKRQ